MSSYDCYFDGSYKPEISGCAFVVEADGKIVHSQVVPEKLTSSYCAELRALHLLLQYIEQHISHGSRIQIFGDAEWLISIVNRKKSRNDKHKTRKLLRRLRHDYTISITHINRRNNKVAHRLARTITCGRSILQPKMFDFTNSKTMRLEHIIVPAHMRSPPKESKYLSRKLFFLIHGEVYKPIHVNAEDVLVDGYISYLILKEYGELECSVIVKS